MRSRTCLAAVAAAGLVLASAAPAWGAADFPRGPGYYYHPFKLVFLLLTYLVWVKTCSWVDADAAELDLPAEKWNLVLFGTGGFCVVAAWFCPWFPLTVVLVAGALAGGSWSYVRVRNAKVPAERRVLTRRHLEEVGRRWLRLRVEEEKTTAKPKGAPIRFLGRSADQQATDKDRVAQVQESKGYKGALEMVYEAVRRRATDIHLEPSKEEMAVRFRIDGIMTTTTPFSRAMGDAVVNIFKVLCDLDITEKRKPQDGSFSAQVENRVVDFRVATAGSVVGEKLVMRILDKNQQIIDLTQLGMRDKMREQVHKLVTQPHGLFLACGPTGSGKSTTLYAALGEIDRFQKNVITIENPVEYRLEGVTQIEVQQRAGKTFAAELRSILRQDPDIIMIGEIRDQETAEIACQAAQTGHMVFSTLHANDTVTAIGRLIDLGVEPFLISSALTAVLGQRLVRLLCSKCKVRYRPNPELLRKANLPAEDIEYFYRPPEEAGTEGATCPKCGGTGYFKRTGVFELLVVTDPIRELIRENPNLNALRQEAVRGGMRFLYEDGLRQVLEGKTSIQELLRVSK